MPNKYVNEDYLPKDDAERKAFLEFLKKQVTDHPVVKEHHGKWKELLAWTDEGEQYSEWDGKSVSPVPLVTRKQKDVINLMKPLAEALDGKIDTSVSVIGMPNSSELIDIEASQVATKLLSANDYTNALDMVFDDFKFDLIHGPGNAFIKITFEEGVNIKIGKKTDEANKAHDAKSYEQTEGKGDVVVQAVSVFNCRPDPAGKTRKTWRWFIELKLATKDEILEKFDVDEDELKASTSDGKQDVRQGMNEPVNERAKDEEDYLLIYYWEKKNSKFTNGRHVITTGNLVLFSGPNSNGIGQIPFFHTYYKRRGNSMWGTSPMHHVQPIQRKINRMISMISEHIESWKPKLGIAPGAFKKGAYTTDAAEILEIDTTGGGVFNIPTPELSGQVPAQRDFLIGAMDKVSNVHEVSYSQLPQYASRAPASLYSMMLEQEDAKIDPLIKRMNRLIIDMAQFRLALMGKFYKEDRMIKVVGKNSQATIQYFKGADLEGNYDVRIEKGVSIHQSKTIQQRLLLELFQSGVIKDNNRILKLLQMGDIEEELRGDIADEARATRENQAFINDTYKKPFEQGGVIVYLHDNHELHLDYHTNLAKSEEAQAWPKEKFKDLNDHIMSHFQLFMQLKQMATQGAGAGAGASGGTTGPSAVDQAGGAGQPGPAPGEQTGGGISAQTMPSATPQIPTPDVNQMTRLTATR